jgi:hypothetical protein
MIACLFDPKRKNRYKEVTKKETLYLKNLKSNRDKGNTPLPH